MELKPLVISCAVLALFASQSADAFVIDTFSDLPMIVNDSTVGGTLVGDYGTGSSAWLGSRLLLVSQRAAPIGGVATGEVNGGWFGSNSPLSTSNTRVVYGATGWLPNFGVFQFDGNRNENLSAFSGVRFTVLAAKAGTRLEWEMSSDGAASLLRTTLTSDVNTATTFDLLFASPTQVTGSFSLASVDYAVANVSTIDVPGGGFVVSKIEFIPVPEPTTMVALGLGLAAVARRRQNRAYSSRHTISSKTSTPSAGGGFFSLKFLAA